MNHKYLIANWKMQLGLAESMALIAKFKSKFRGMKSAQIVVCPSFISMDAVRKVMRGTNIQLGAQDLSWFEKGAYTGEISANDIKELGARYVIIGHSERRHYLRESCSLVNAKAKTAISAGLIPVICVGEDLARRRAGKTKDYVAGQLRRALKGLRLGKSKIIIAYEPIWAIGTGKVINTKDVEKELRYIRDIITRLYGADVARKNFAVLYGGSVDVKNVRALSAIQGMDGFLVGGASLRVDEFYKIGKLMLQ